jgi:hypothetical protein
MSDQGAKQIHNLGTFRLEVWDLINDYLYRGIMQFYCSDCTNIYNKFNL